MIYTNKTKKALMFMFEKHKNQVDKSGVPYVFHPFMVAQDMKDEISTIVALLHDILEDTDTTEEEIINLGFSNRVIEALRLLNHDKNEDYFDYINKISKNKIATIVKLSDLRHNSDLSRQNRIKEKDITRYEKYAKAIEILNLALYKK